jgi:hypothetical protein
MTKLAQLAHLQVKMPGKSSSWYRKVLGLNSKTYRQYSGIVQRLLGGTNAVNAKPVSIHPSVMVQFGETGSLYN